MIHPPLLPFKGSSLKLDRGRKHLAELQRMVDDHLATKPIKHRIVPANHLGGLLVETDFRGLPEDCGPIIGDCVHNLRCALDLMACDLARLKGKSPKNVYFPFADSAGELDWQIKQKHFTKAGPEAVALLKQIAPHRGGNTALRALHDLDVQDKHQTIVPIMMNFDGPPMKIRRATEQSLSIRIAVADLESSACRFLFPDDSAFAGEEIVPTLQKLVELTAGVIEAFEALSKVPGFAVDAAAAHVPPPNFEVRVKVTEHDLTPEELAQPVQPAKSDGG